MTLRVVYDTNVVVSSLSSSLTPRMPASYTTQHGNYPLRPHQRGRHENLYFQSCG